MPKKKSRRNKKCSILVKYFFIFFTCCLIGWIYEEIYYLITRGKIINSGFLYGPYLPVYGFGGIFLYFTLSKYQTNLISIDSVKIFFIGLIAATTLEYFTSFILEKIFKARWWDYHNMKFIHGNNGIIILVPFGVTFNTSLLSAFGPTIPIKVSFIDK